MTSSRERARKVWLRQHDGTQVAVGPSGVLIGRAPTCDIVLVHEEASRNHALVHLSADGPAIVAMGRTPTSVNGTALDGRSDLGAGDRIGVPGLELELIVEAGPHDEAAFAWLLERQGGGLFGVPHSPYLVGGGVDDDLRVRGMAPGSLRFRLAQGALFVEPAVEIRVGERTCGPDEVVGLRPHDEIAVGAERIRVIAGGEHGQRTTVVADRTEIPRRVSLEFLPRGGRLTLGFKDGETTTYLADRRCDLVAALLQPPGGAPAGDWVSDDALAPRVWPGKDGMGRTDINVLVYRLRRDLVGAGVNGVRLIERADGGGATRFTLGAGAEVVVR